MNSADPSTLRLAQLAGVIPAAAVGLALAVPAWAMQSPAEPPVRDAIREAAQDGKDAANESARVVVGEDQTVDLHVKDESISNVLELLSIQTQKNIIASKSVSGKVNADLYKVTFTEAMDSILHPNGWAYQMKGNFVYVYTREELAEIQKSLAKRVAKVMRLNYLNAVDAAEFVKPLLSKEGEVKTSTKTEEFTIPENAPVGKDDFALGATLVVIDLEDNVAAVEALLLELDTRPAQVLVEATILQSTLREDNAFGVDFSIIGDLRFLDFATIGGPRAAADALIKGASGTPAGFSPPDNEGSAISTSVGQTGEAGGFKVGIITDTVAAFVRMLDQVTDTTVISNPKIMALNRQPSRVIVGQRIGYLSTTTSDTATTQTVQFLDTGVQLFFRPFVSANGEIRMELKPSVSSGSPRNVSVGTGTTSVVDEDTQSIVTNVLVRDGMTIVLGGLFKETTRASRRQVPVLGDIPIIGTAFRGHDDSTTRDEFIFLIKPSIITYATAAAQGQTGIETVSRVRAGARQGLLPWSREKMTSTLNVEAETAARAGDSDKALWLLQRSLSLNARQPEAYQLREKLTGQREDWPSRSFFDVMLDEQVSKRLEAVPPAPAPAPDLTPYGSVPLPERPVDAREPLNQAADPVPLSTPISLSPSAAQPVQTPAVAVAAPGNAFANGPEVTEAMAAAFPAPPAGVGMMAPQSATQMLGSAEQLLAAMARTPNGAGGSANSAASWAFLRGLFGTLPDPSVANVPVENK
ncbi:MAG: type II secretion system protein GspD [Phycisphaerales bacterium]